MRKYRGVGSTILANANVWKCVGFIGFCLCEVNHSVSRQKARQAAAANPNAPLADSASHRV